MAKRRITKESKRRLAVFGTISILVIFYFIFSLGYNVYTIYDLTNQKKNLEKNYERLQEEAEQLKIDIEKFSDEKYLADYAREHYLYSKDGEYILQIEDLENIQKEKNNELDEISIEINNMTITINRNYLVLALSFIMFVIFIILIAIGRKKKK